MWSQAIFLSKFKHDVDIACALSGATRNERGTSRNISEEEIQEVEKEEEEVEEGEEEEEKEDEEEEEKKWDKKRKCGSR